MWNHAIIYSIHVSIHLTWKRIWLDVPGVAAWLRTCLSADVSIPCLGLVGHKWEQTESWSHRGIKAWTGHWWWGHLTRKRMLQRLIAKQWRTTMHNMLNWGLNSRQHSRMKIYLGLMDQTWPDPTEVFQIFSNLIRLILNHDDAKPGFLDSVTQWIGLK